MRVQICTVGRLRNGPERDLITDYLDRFDKTGRQLGLGPHRLNEVEDRKGGRAEVEADLLRKAMPDQNPIWCLDERGMVMTSPDFADALAEQRDQGVGELSFAIGGADGLTKEFRSQTTRKVSFGKMVWPHALARVMLAEQLYRAATILAGTPYHRV